MRLIFRQQKISVLLSAQGHRFEPGIEHFIAVIFCRDGTSEELGVETKRGCPQRFVFLKFVSRKRNEALERDFSFRKIQTWVETTFAFETQTCVGTVFTFDCLQTRLETKRKFLVWNGLRV